MDIMMESFKIQSALAELGISIESKRGNNSYFQGYLANLFASQFETNFPLVDMERELARMWAFIAQLRELRSAQPIVFKKSLKNLNKHKSRGELLGLSV